MPVYDYECSKCKKVHEVTQKFADAPLTLCPDVECKGEVKKLLSLGGGFALKGTGFYTTDYKRAAPKGPALASPASDAGAKPSSPAPAASAPKKSEP